MTLSPVSRLSRPSTWFVWHGHRHRPGMPGARSGLRRGTPQPRRRGARRATSTAVDRDEARLATAREQADGARSRRSTGAWRTSRGRGPSWAALMRFWCSIILTGPGCPRMRELVAPGGFLMMETFLTAQRELGWGPTSDDHLLRPGELAAPRRAADDPARPRGARAGRRRALARGGERRGRRKRSTARRPYPLARCEQQVHMPNPGPADGSPSSPACARRSPRAGPSSATSPPSALARHAARELLVRSELDGREVDEVIFGQVVPSVRSRPTWRAR